jgi:sulfate permease, SulP family
VFSKGYGIADLRADVLAGVVVGIVALPLSMALAIAVGAPPPHSLYTAIVAGTVTALLGGCKFQVTGPTAAFVVILAPIYNQHGLAGLLTAGALAGILLVAMGVARLGDLIRFIPHPVTTGFTTGIATVIATLQLKDAFGLTIATMPDHYIDRVQALWDAHATMQPEELAVAVGTLGLLLLTPRLTKRVPAPLVAIAMAAIATTLLSHSWSGFHVATIGTRFQSVVDGIAVAGIPRSLPTPALPWGDTGLTLDLVRALLPAAFAIAMLAAIESLLSAVIADGMTNTKHEPNSELVALGIGNIVAPLFGGIAATGALARTATNIRAGARSPFAAVTHSIVVLLAVLLLAPLVSYVPMASLAALLLLVAWNMSELHNVLGIVRVGPKSDVLVLVTCFALTVFVDMVAAICVGFVLAAILFMRRMSELTESRIQLDSSEEADEIALPKGVMLYEINGPLFFGAAQKAMGAFSRSQSNDFRVLVLHLGRVPVIDVTGLVAMENMVSSVLRMRRRVVIAGPLPRPHEVFERANLEAKHQGLVIVDDLDTALEVAARIVAGPASIPPSVA